MGNGTEVVFLPGEQSSAERIAQRLFHRRLQAFEYAGLAGALDDARVEVGASGRRLYLELSDRLCGTYRGYFYVYAVSHKLVLTIDGMHILYRDLRRCGLGLRMFSRQVDAAVVLGIRRMELVAGRRNEENGYYTWPRFGFEAMLPMSLRRVLPMGLEHARTVLDVMEIEKGRKWWREHGTKIRAMFDLSIGSRSLEVLRRYQREETKSLDGTKRNLEMSRWMSYGNVR